MKKNELLNPINIGNWYLKSKIVMAPMTRSFANNNTGTVDNDIVTYYRRRAKDGIGLIITEGINPSLRGRGTFGVPGLYTTSQVDAWRNVTEENIRAFIQVFKESGIEIIHPSTNNFIEKMANGMTFHQLVRKHWDGIIIGVGNLNTDIASEAIKNGTIDLAAFGRPLLANPDFVQKIKEGIPIKPYQAAIDLKYLN
ncbi:oxidoreductase [Evansella halocellulosilytica]|uniref:oxidoreductase n=1 Tax=Evansella halocellulosilytica TaxID=2011013 RepID=UPI000BB93245|nr:hypothetical protein [Evansella halocellulosilytica]